MILLWGFVLKHHGSGCRRLRLHNAFNLIILAESYHSWTGRRVASSTIYHKPVITPFPSLLSVGVLESIWFDL